MNLRLAIALALATGACRRPPEAPEALDELTRYLYAEWDNEDPRVLAAGLDNLRLQLDDVDYDGALQDRSWELTPMNAASVSDVPHPDRDPQNTLGVAVTFQSVWPGTDHARLQTEADQTVTEPSAATYDRTFPEVDDPGCFVDAGCEVLVTENLVERQNLIISVQGTLFKQFRWSELEDGEMAFISRSWIAEPWVGDNNNNTIWQSYSIDVWLPGPGGARRFQTLWSESEVGGASDSILITTVKVSTDDIFEAGDAAIETLYHSR